MKNREIFDNLIKDINWENFEVDKEQEDEQTEYFDLCEVFNCKLEWLKETLDDDNDVEHIDTIEQVQKLLSLLNENKIKQIL